MHGIDTGYNPEGVEGSLENIKIAQAAQEKEAGFMQKLAGKAREISVFMTMVTAFVIAEANFNRAYAEDDNDRGKQTEVEPSTEQKSVNLMRKLYNLPDNPMAVNSVQNGIMKGEAARTMIQAFALELSQAPGAAPREISGQVGPRDIAEAVKNLIGSIDQFTDQVLGDNDGKVEDEEKAKFRGAMKDNPGLQALMEMYRQYKGMFPEMFNQ
ncbi:MAG: hypothetical protein WC480_02000 [Patescibacteria group bacterium]